MNLQIGNKPSDSNKRYIIGLLLVVFIGGMLSSISLLQFTTKKDTRVLFVDGAPKLIIVDVINTGTSPITINSAKVNADSVAILIESPVIIATNASVNLVLEAEWVDKKTCEIEIYADDGTLIRSYQSTP